MSSTRFRKRDEALGATMRDMVTAKYVAEAAVAPHSPKGSQVERCGQYGPLGRHVCQTSQEEPPARSLLLDNPEHRLRSSCFLSLYTSLAAEVAIQARWRRSAASYGPTDTLRPFLLFVHTPKAGHARQTAPGAR